MKPWMLIATGFVVHGVLFISVFDIYFSAPIVKGMTPRKSDLPPPAKRVVFIVADGLRADKLLELRPDGSTPAPFIRSIVEEKGSWGVSWAGVPTATRPGHVAMTAGYYEDPTSVAKDISGGDITFDTVFNESRYLWAWDTPQFLAKVVNDHKDRMFSEKFPGDHKYLAGIRPTEMDTWVFNEFHDFLQSAKGNNPVKTMLKEDQVFLFLHLGGIDHAGYIVRPNAPEYLEHVTLLDNGVRKVVAEVENFYDNDGKTAFLFTSDHGMSNWGAHGDGSPHEIQTPLVVWGAGVKKSSTETNLDRFADTISQDWSLSKWKRTDIEQTSIAPLLAALIGVPFPMNAVYPLPTDILDLPEEEMAHVMIANLYQLLDHYVALKKAIFHGPLAFNFRSFTYLTSKDIDSIKTDLDSLIKVEGYQQAIEMAREKTELTLKGIRHYRTYSRTELWLSTNASIIGWFCLLALVLIEQHLRWEDIKDNCPLMANTKHIMQQCACALAVFYFIFLYAQKTPLTNCVHFLLPIPLWTAVIIKWYEVGNILPIIKRQKEHLPAFGITLACIVAICLSNYYRIILSLCLIAIAYWPCHVSTTPLNKSLKYQWFGSILGIAILSGRPFGDRGLHYNLVLLSGIVAALAAGCIRWKHGRSIIKGRWFRNFGWRFVNFQIVMIVVSTVLVYYTSYLTENDIRTPLLNQTLSWTILIVSLLEPFIVSTEIQSRLLTMVLSFISPFILLSIAQESLYYVFLCWNVYVFIEVEKHVTSQEPLVVPKNTEPLVKRVPNMSIGNQQQTNGHSHGGRHHKHTKSNDIMIFQQVVNEWQKFDFIPDAEHETQNKRKITSGDIRRALYFVIIMYTTIFGTGHIASVNSFDVQDVFCFITISNPPRMGVLMVFKVCIPGLVLGCFIRAMNLITFTSLKNFSVLLMLMTNIVGALFLWFVTDVGSWTTVGQTVSHHVLGHGVGMFSCLQFGASYLLTTVKV